MTKNNLSTDPLIRFLYQFVNEPKNRAFNNIHCTKLVEIHSTQMICK